jgi:hypothetical protein
MQGTTLGLGIVSNSTIADLVFDPGRQLINFTASGPENTVGFCNLTIAKQLLNGSPVVLVDDSVAQASVSEDGTHYYVSFSYSHSQRKIAIGGHNTIPELPYPLIPLVLILILAALMLKASSKENKRMPLR